MDTLQLKNNLKALSDEYFEKMRIDQETGIVDGTNRRFAGYPYIGRNYVNAPLRILFIALDTGSDECAEENTFHSFESREEIFVDGNLRKFNAHIAGLYATALYLLKDTMGWQLAWETLWSQRDKFKTAKAIRDTADFLPTDLMSYIAYDNRFKFVTCGRTGKTGGKDREWIEPAFESEWLLKEIDLFNPNFIVLQGKSGLWNCRVEELRKKYYIIETIHPSCWQRGADKLQYIKETVDLQK